MNAPLAPQTIYLADYQVPAYLVKTVDLHFDLDPAQTLVSSKLEMMRNPAGQGGALKLDGEQLQLHSVTLNGQRLSEAEYDCTDSRLVIDSLPDEFTLEIVTEIQPDQNTALEGLYHSGQILCTQCEAEGFRRITYYPDRPDVLAVFTVTLTADKAQWPIMLSNGNQVASGEFEDGRHWVCWHDPHPKPAYLFALVAGDLYCQQDSFTTMSGRQVTLQIFVDPENKAKCDHALLSLKQAMQWDEQAFGREYDLDIFMIVAVNDFNMGAMENKGLNIFNAACVLASPETATDDDFYTIQSIVGHEYFHNWSGNRVTCRDWFQLSLKEGFTVMRDQSFSADLNSAAVQRIDDVDMLRRMQFAEDAGPMAHPVRPDSYMEISNFYTVTIYEKGAEVVRMLKTLAGDAGFRRGTDLYFARHDGQAVTTDDFVSAIEEANDLDLAQFQRWYTQAGTPELTVECNYNQAEKTLTVTLQQSCPATPGQPEKQPFLIPVAVGLIGEQGQSLPLQLTDETQPIDGDTRVLLLTENQQNFTFINLPERPKLSVLRGFSAPVKLTQQRDNAELAFMMANDSDSFNRWDAGQTLFINILLALIAEYQSGSTLVVPELLTDQLAAILDNASVEPALTARMLTLPSENYLAAQMAVADVDAIHAVRSFVKRSLAVTLKIRFENLYQQLHQIKPYEFNAADLAQRSLKNTCLSYLMTLTEPVQVERCLAQMAQANNMTDLLAGLRLIVDVDGPQRQQALESFYQQWQHDRQVVDKWLTVQALSTLPGTLTNIKSLMQHPAFSLKNPNNVRALIGQFCRNNPSQFHARDGSGYQFLAEQIIALDKLNPQVAARQLGAFNSWRRYNADRQKQMQAALQMIADKSDLSPDVYEIVSKYLAD
ncbi:Membrane alanine aminopeptidase N [Methylophaga frappieri]|uniref:Aminopeptidase N n=1 Tax=Methylophaga frappieri (strain ATCC BAA-2434 / DSM 25690 / JAM7) TaxID=754477 RepID=I1YEI6_METFJ|nr:aminopeptidase N [Methylophaga frappieri]AFJ01329.1 Membrane alanine aminopeptidase N [Methylophaga frappieri]